MRRFSWVAAPLLGMAAFLALPAGCAARAVRPLRPDEWKAGLEPSPKRLPYVVTVFQRMGWWHVAYGCGCIVHSCREHGTYVLTAYHCVSEPGAVRVWAYGGSSSGARGRLDDLDCYSARIVYPPLEDFGSDAMGRLADAMRDWDLTWHRDFAVLRLETGDLFEPVPIHRGPETDLPEGSPVQLAAVSPEQYPHLHDFAWGPRYPDDVFREGHSGAAILLAGELFALIASRWTFAETVMQRPVVAEVRKHLKAAGLEFVLGPGACGSPGGG